MRYALFLVLGLAVGAFGAIKIHNSLLMRDAYPRGVMHVMSHHMGVLGGNARAGKCPADVTRKHLELLDTMQAQIIPAMGKELGSKPDFRKHAQKLKQAIQGALANVPADCPALKKAMSSIGGSCKSCHQTYR